MTSTASNSDATTLGPRDSAGAATSESSPSTKGQAGDLARRVTYRRTELGLSTEELARQAGIDAWFLAYFEQSSDTTLTSGSLLRLAIALQTTPLALEGGQIDRPLGSGHAGPHPRLEPLSTEACEDHLRAGGVGRIVYSTPSGPVAFPVNFVYSERAIIFRTSDSVANAIAGIVAFEVDHIDDAMSEGWSVLVKGRARLIEDPDERHAVALLDIDPWAGGARLNVVRIEAFELTGRVIVQRQSSNHS